jgi:hypothetical protein
MLPGWPFLNSMVTRSYPAWAPVRIASTNAVAGDGLAVMVDDAQVKAAWLPPALCAVVGLATGEGADAPGVTVEPTGSAPVGWGRFALTANMTPTATAAAKTAATPTIR